MRWAKTAPLLAVPSGPVPSELPARAHEALADLRQAHQLPTRLYSCRPAWGASAAEGAAGAAGVAWECLAHSPFAWECLEEGSEALPEAYCRH